jgi:uncharacterized RDD family membrane protein YckC
MPGLWGKRLVALIIDAVIITLILWVILALIYPLLALANLFFLANLWIPLAVLLIIVYFTYFEGRYSATPGKNVMKLRVKALKGKMGYRKAFIRNLSKILWLPLIVDVIIGFALGSPRERYLDRLAKTEVVKADELENPRKDLKQSLS